MLLRLQARDKGVDEPELPAGNRLVWSRLRRSGTPSATQIPAPRHTTKDARARGLSRRVRKGCWRRPAKDRQDPVDLHAHRAILGRTVLF